MIRIGIALIQGNSTADQVISAVSGSPDTHIALRIQQVSEKGVIDYDHKLEAISGYGVIEDDWSILLSQTASRRVLSVYEPKWDLFPAMAYARSQVGKPYSTMSVLGAGLAKLWGAVFGTRHNVFAGVNCTSLVCKALQAANYPGAKLIDSGGSTPAQLEDLLKKNQEPLWMGSGSAK